MDASEEQDSHMGDVLETSTQEDVPSEKAEDDAHHAQVLHILSSCSCYVSPKKKKNPNS